MANTINIIAGKLYPTNVNSVGFKLVGNIAAIMGKTAEAAVAKVASLIQHCNGTSANIAIRWDSAAGRNRAAQRFLATENYTITAASVALGRVSTPGSHCWLELWSVTGSLPATVLATSNKYTIASLPQSGISPILHKGFTFSTTPAVASGVNYALAIAGNNGLKSSSVYILGLRSGHAIINYPNGHFVDQTREGTWAKGVGAGFDIDMGFRVFGTPILPLSQDGIYFGGQNNAGAHQITMDHISIDTPGNADDHGDLTQSRSHLDATDNGSNDRGVIGSGFVATYVNNI